MWCSGPPAPRLLKQWDVYIKFILDLVLGTSSPSLSKTVGCFDENYLRCGARDLRPLTFYNSEMFRLNLSLGAWDLRRLAF